MLAFEENPERVERSDLVVGIPSHNEAENIAHPTEQAAKGLLDHFGGKNSVIINCDNHSEDGTKDAFLQAVGEIPKIYLSNFFRISVLNFSIFSFILSSFSFNSCGICGA